MSEKAVIPIERIAEKIYLIREEKVMLDADLAALYGVETRVLVQAVKGSDNQWNDYGKLSIIVLIESPRL